VISADASGRAFLVQTGDPTGTGRGGSGDLTDFERSTLAHTRGVVSMARLPDDPNTNGSQFLICLSREACAKLDGRYTSFGTVVEGLETLDAIASTPLAPAEDEGLSVPQRPIRPPVLHEARAVDAPPVDIAAPARRGDEAPAAR
jgi:peptidylprolyl isomerase